MRAEVMEFYGLTRSPRAVGYYETAHHGRRRRCVRGFLNGRSWRDWSDSRLRDIAVSHASLSLVAALHPRHPTDPYASRDGVIALFTVSGEHLGKPA